MDSPTFQPPTSRHLVRSWGKEIIARAIAPLQRALGSRRENVFGILMYHRITETVPGAPAPTHNVTPRRFRRQMEGLLNRGFRPWPLGRLIDDSARGHSIPRQAFAVTFDDGFANNALAAWPVLRELGIPATIFLATAYLDSPSRFPFDDWSAAGSVAVPSASWIPLTTAQCRALSEGGLIEFGCHTHTHAVFRGRPQAFEADLQLSVEALRREFGVERPPFAFPFGIADRDLRDAARRMPVSCGLTTYPSVVERGSDPVGWSRFGVSQSDTAATLAAKLGGWYDLARETLGAWRLRRSAAGPETRDATSRPVAAMRGPRR